jgi:hypothetical protein
MRSLPERPDLRQLKIQAKDLVKAVQSANPDALERVRSYFSPPVTLAQAQLVVAREYGFPSWKALAGDVEKRTLESRMQAAIDAGDLPRVREIVASAREAVTMRMRWCDGGNAFVYAAQSGQMAIMLWLADHGPTDLQHALSRAAMRYHPAVMEQLMRMGADPIGNYSATNSEFAVITAVAEALNPDAMRALVDLGAPVRWTDEQGRDRSIPAYLLTIYSRGAARKAACLDICESAGTVFPDTPAMRIHRRRPEGIDLTHHFSREEVYPAELGCRPEDGLVATPIEGATALHLAVEFDDLETTESLLKQGADPNARVREPDGHTPLFHTAITLGRRTDEMARLLVRYGADPTLRATVRRRVPLGEEPEPSEERVFKHVTPGEFGAFDWPFWVLNRAAADFLKSQE